MRAYRGSGPCSGRPSTGRSIAGPGKFFGRARPEPIEIVAHEALARISPELVPFNLIEMPSKSLIRWNVDRARALDEIRDAHSALGGRGRGRRYATQQVNHAYLVLLSSQFQGFCRDLHSEAVDFLIGRVQPVSLQQILRARFTEGRKLDTGNPNPGNLGSDFGRLGMELWTMVSTVDRRNTNRKKELEKLNYWRNAIAHQDVDPVRLRQLTGKTKLGLKDVGLWRSACAALATSFDRAVRDHMKTLVGATPW